MPLTEGVTEYVPAKLFAVKVDAMATPCALVVAVVVKVPEFANVPLGPLEGAVKVTRALLTTFLELSITRTFSGVGNAVFSEAL